ncbi:MAG: LysR family transcriptional regulator [Granulosicoccus sp.]|nr:LysR family transcriptional regulator [Granulosicoccus sp.]
MPIPYTQLRAFHAVASHGSFTKAAAALHVTQPTLSGQVKELEDRYGVKLFARYGRKVSLTDFGQSAFEITQKIYREQQAVEQLFLSAQGLRSGQLTVGADSPYIITPLLATFQRRYPGVQISIHYGNTTQNLHWLQSQQCDIAILADVPQEGPKLSVVKLKPDHLVAFVDRDHTWADRRSVTLEELISQRLIYRERGSHTRAIFEQAVSLAGLVPKNIMEISSREGVREAVGAGLGVGIVSETELGTDSRLRPLQIRDANLVYSESIICLATRSGERTIKAFLEQIGPDLVAS